MMTTSTRSTESSSVRFDLARSNYPATMDITEQACSVFDRHVQTNRVQVTRKRYNVKSTHVARGHLGCRNKEHPSQFSHLRVAPHTFL